MLLMILHIYIILVSIFSIVITIYDKFAAKIGIQRVRESFLFLLSFLGGGVAMFATMLIIRHKTKHLNFMIGIPIIIVVQLVGYVALRIFLYA